MLASPPPLFIPGSLAFFFLLAEAIRKLLFLACRKKADTFKLAKEKVKDFYPLFCMIIAHADSMGRPIPTRLFIFLKKKKETGSRCDSDRRLRVREERRIDGRSKKTGSTAYSILIQCVFATEIWFGGPLSMADLL